MRVEGLMACPMPSTCDWPRDFTVAFYGAASANSVGLDPGRGLTVRFIGCHVFGPCIGVNIVSLSRNSQTSPTSIPFTKWLPTFSWHLRRRFSTTDGNDWAFSPLAIPESCCSRVFPPSIQILTVFFYLECLMSADASVWHPTQVAVAKSAIAFDGGDRQRRSVVYPSPVDTSTRV